MNWEDWVKVYPAKNVDTLPDYQNNEVFDDYVDAVLYKENLEIEQDCGGFEIVEFEGKYYLINSD